MANANSVIKDVELHWCSVDKNNPVDSFKKKVWSLAVHANKDTAKRLKKEGLVRNLNEVEDEEGNETGLYKINMSKLAVSRAGKDLKPVGVFIQDEKTGKMEPLDTSTVGIGNGSVGHVSYSIYDWSFEGNKGKSMSLANVVVTRLVPYVRTQDADEFGIEMGSIASEFEVKDIKETDDDDVF